MRAIFAMSLVVLGTTQAWAEEFEIRADVNVPALNQRLKMGWSADADRPDFTNAYKWELMIIDADSGTQIASQYVNSHGAIFHFDQIYIKAGKTLNVRYQLIHHHLLGANEKAELGAIGVGTKYSMRGLRQDVQQALTTSNITRETGSSDLIVTSGDKSEVRHIENLRAQVSTITQFFAATAVALSVERHDPDTGSAKVTTATTTPSKAEPAVAIKGQNVRKPAFASKVN